MTSLAALAALALSALPPPGVVDGATAQRLAAAGATIVDVRSPGEYAEGHIPGARLIPHDQVAARATEVGPKDRPVLLYCRSGRRTALARGDLVRLGFTAVYDMQGLANWPGPVARGAAP
jgi:phage shock protein E